MLTHAREQIARESKTAVENCARAVQILFALAIFFSFPKVSYCRGWVINKLQTYSVRNQVYLINAEFRIKYLVSLQTIKNTGFIQEN